MMLLLLQCCMSVADAQDEVVPLNVLTRAPVLYQIRCTPQQISTPGEADKVVWKIDMHITTYELRSSLLQKATMNGQTVNAGLVDGIPPQYMSSKLDVPDYMLNTMSGCVIQISVFGKVGLFIECSEKHDPNLPTGNHVPEYMKE
eukprot:GEMP01108094.1.p1 GENE.GEMP01108094.1~~GEMP01108094.1.p1  ORF type:complete len:145 (+),score=22.61 GEMP01108094.1:63-497(+)